MASIYVHNDGFDTLNNPVKVREVVNIVRGPKGTDPRTMSVSQSIKVVDVPTVIVREFKPQIVDTIKVRDVPRISLFAVKPIDTVKTREFIKVAHIVPEHTVGRKVTADYANLLFTPDLANETVTTITALYDDDYVELVNWSEYLELEVIGYTGGGFPVIFTAYDYCGAESTNISPGQAMWITYVFQIYDNTAEAVVEEIYLECRHYFMTTGGVFVTKAAYQPIGILMADLIADHDYDFIMAVRKDRTGTPTMTVSSQKRVMVIQEVKR